MKHVITFLQQAKKVANTITSELKVDSKNTVEDVLPTGDTTGALVAEIDNNIAEIKWKLEEYYQKTGNTKMLKRLEKLND